MIGSSNGVLLEKLRGVFGIKFELKTNGKNHRRILKAPQLRKRVACVDDDNKAVYGYATRQVHWKCVLLGWG
jgi:hypothetical protein